MALTQFNEWEPTLDPVNGVMQQEPRVFGHDAKLIVIGAINNSDANHGIKVTNAGTTYSVNDTITLTTTGTATVAAVVTVLAVDSSAGVTDYEVTTVGARYQVGDTETDSGAGAFACTITNIDIPNTQKRGCCLYVGSVTGGAQMKVVMEAAKHDGTSGTGYAATDTVTFDGVLAGGYNPIMVKQLVYNATGPTSVIALY